MSPAVQSKIFLRISPAINERTDGIYAKNKKKHFGDTVCTVIFQTSTVLVIILLPLPHCLLEFLIRAAPWRVSPHQPDCAERCTRGRTKDLNVFIGRTLMSVCLSVCPFVAFVVTEIDIKRHDCTLCYRVLKLLVTNY